MTGNEELRAVGRPRLFETSRVSPQPKLFALDSLGDPDSNRFATIAGLAYMP
jgi:hypothetical protein